jgi:hypothetical protein
MRTLDRPQYREPRGRGMLQGGGKGVVPVCHITGITTALHSAQCTFGGTLLLRALVYRQRYTGGTLPHATNVACGHPHATMHFLDEKKGGGRRAGASGTGVRGHIYAGVCGHIYRWHQIARCTAVRHIYAGGHIYSIQRPAGVQQYEDARCTGAEWRWVGAAYGRME